MRISFQLRLRIYERDRFTCAYCLEPLDRFSDQLTLDHANPVGGNTFENLVTCCLSCNVRKGGSTAEKFKARIAGDRDAATTALGLWDPEIKAIMKAAVKRFKLSESEITFPDHGRARVAVRRWIAQQARSKGISLPRIANVLRRHHTTVINLLRPPL